MKCIIFSDIHGNNHAFEAFLEKIKDEEFDKIIFLGDFIGYYYSPNDIIEKCITLNVTCLLGNHDSYFLRALKEEIELIDLVSKYGNSYNLAMKTMASKSIDFLAQLKPSMEVLFHGKKVLFCHGSPINPLEGRIYPDTNLEVFSDYLNFDYIICGHTHHKIERKLNKTYFLNPGSLGQQRDGKGCSYLYIDFENDSWRIETVSYKIEQLEKQIDLFDNGSLRFKEVLRRLPK